MLVAMETGEDGSESGTVQQVRTWLRKTGYSVELRTAAAFQAQRLAVEAARYYLDRDGETLREIDVVATGWQTKGTPAAAATLEVVHVVECKGASGHPWVAFLGDNRFSRDEDVLETMRIDRRGGTLDHRNGEYTVNGLAVVGLHHAPLLTWTDRTAYSVTETGGKPGQSYNAVRQVLSAVDGYARDMPDRTDREVVRVTIPIVVTAAPLVTCRLDEDGDVVLEEVDRVLLAGRLRAATHLTGVWIVQDSAIEAVARDARRGVDRLVLRRDA